MRTVATAARGDGGSVRRYVSENVPKRQTNSGGDSRDAYLIEASPRRALSMETERRSMLNAPARIESSPWIIPFCSLARRHRAARQCRKSEPGHVIDLASHDFILSIPPSPHLPHLPSTLDPRRPEHVPFSVAIDPFRLGVRKPDTPHIKCLLFEA